SCVTWNGVYDSGGTSAANANTFQFQFDRSTGNVSILWQATSALGNGRIVGYSPGGASADPGNRDLSATLAATFALAAADAPALALDATARPLLGSNLLLATANIPAGASLGATILGFQRIDPGLSLLSLGMPGCFQYTSPIASVVMVPAG